jgi:hypothetical protein
MRQIVFTRIAQRALDRMPTNTSRLIVGKIRQYADDPNLSREMS